ncbi:14334_t:CDS:2, partial [Ambispora leptoticha]
VITNVPKASSTKDIPDPSPDIEHSPTKSEELEIRCSASPSATSLPQDDTSKQIEVKSLPEVDICEEIDRYSDPSEVKIQVSAPDNSRSGDAIASEDSNYEYDFEDPYDNNEEEDDDGFCGFSDDDYEGYYYDLNTGETYTKSERSICAY